MEDGITPTGFGPQRWKKPCFCTQYRTCYVYLPHELAKDRTVAQSIFAQALPCFDGSLIYKDHLVDIEIGEETWHLRLRACFNHFLVERL